MDRSQVFIKQPNVSARHLERRGAVAEDALQREDVTAVGEEGTGKAVPEDVG